ncbi:hypothetical protein DF3PB_3510003 [uncultured Defluviicoccus sp.]|uniref:Uncharacterized protein n=1 Tax=metagenome TaxID=256318 RepID=A0A380TES4_9ZZZZ|nr:hypothetical protein DF3PB_3510003 [uncultured Defluviicoccus sp.]
MRRLCKPGAGDRVCREHPGRGRLLRRPLGRRCRRSPLPGRRGAGAKPGLVVGARVLRPRMTVGGDLRAFPVVEMADALSQPVMAGGGRPSTACCKQRFDFERIIFAQALSAKRHHPRQQLRCFPIRDAARSALRVLCTAR